jgi:hypothetical protein
MLIRLSDTEIDSRLVNVFVKSMPQELIDKPVVMSDGSIGVVKGFDPEDIEYPMIDIGGEVIKSNANLFCSCMHSS